MKIVITENYFELSEKVAEMIKHQLLKKPDSVLGMITGGTPIGLYQKLVDYYRKKEIDFELATVFNVDEYVGLSKKDEQSYNAFMRKNLINHINIKEENFNIPNGLAKNLEKECLDYEEKIKKVGGIDLQLLGIGSDGHIAFNEPGTSFSSRTHISELEKATIEDNSRFFEDEEDVPKKAITVGIKTILEAKKIVLLVSGSSKADICKKLIEDAPSVDLPASAIKEHKDVTIFLDKQVASKLINY